MPRLRALRSAAADAASAYERLTALVGEWQASRVLITFSDRDHFSEQWTRSENGRDTVFDLHFVRRY